MSIAKVASHVLVIGAGTMGGGIASSFAAVGWNVHVMTPSQKTRDALIGRMRANLRTLNADPAEADATKIYATLSEVPWKVIDLVIESVTEDLPLKQRLFIDLERFSRSDAIL